MLELLLFFRLDLVVERITVTGDSAQVVIKNQGLEPVTADTPFWVDLYVNPHPLPTGVNQTWSSLCGEGMAWGVEGGALPLGPGEELTLVNGDAYYRAEYSNFSGVFAAGVPIYVQVDSANADTSHGAVLESHEIAGEAYNNIGGPAYVSAAGRQGDADADADADRRRSDGRLGEAGPDRLPARP